MSKQLSLCVILCVTLSTSVAFARDGHGKYHHAGASVRSPGTNSAKTARSTDEGENFGNYTSFVVSEEKRLRKVLGSTICRGC